MPVYIFVFIPSSYDLDTFLFSEPLSGKKNQCCGAKAFNDQRQECCEENSIAPIGTCPAETSQE